MLVELSVMEQRYQECSQIRGGVPWVLGPGRVTRTRDPAVACTRPPALGSPRRPRARGSFRALRRAGLIDPKAKRRRDRRFLSPARAMELCQMDVVGGVLLSGGRD